MKTCTENKKTADSSTHESWFSRIGGAFKGILTIQTYSYNRAWSETPIDSARVKKPSGHANPGTMPYTSTQKAAGDVNLGAFTWSSSLVGKINNFESPPVESGFPLHLSRRMTVFRWLEMSIPVIFFRRITPPCPGLSGQSAAGTFRVPRHRALPRGGRRSVA